MTSIVSLVLLGGASAACGQQPGQQPAGQPAGQAVNWQQDVEAAKRMAAASNRLVLLHFGAEWCGPCKQMEQTVFAQPSVGQALESNYVMVKVDLDRSQVLAQAYGVKGVPCDVVIKPTGEMVAKRSGATDANGYVAYFSQVAAGSGRMATAVAGAAAQGNPAARSNHSNLLGPRYANLGGAAGQPAEPTNQSQTPLGSAGPRYGGNSNVGSGGVNQEPQGGQRGAPAYTASQSSSNATGQPHPQMAANRPTNSGPGSQTAMSPNTRGQQPGMPGAQTRVPSHLQTQPRVGQAYPPRAQPQSGYGAPAAQAPPALPQGQAQGQPQGPQAQPQGPPSMALEGYCAVQLMENRAWTKGDARFGAVHRGQTYLFAGPEEQRKFLANPDYYSPVYGGHDLVLARDQGHLVPGDRRHGIFLGDRVYLFTGEETLQRFCQNPQRYLSVAR